MQSFASIRAAFVAASLVLVGIYAPASGQTLSKGYQVLLNRGFQNAGLVTKDNAFHLQPVSNGPSLTGG